MRGARNAARQCATIDEFSRVSALDLRATDIGAWPSGSGDAAPDAAANVAVEVGAGPSCCAC